MAPPAQTGLALIWSAAVLPVLLLAAVNAVLVWRLARTDRKWGRELLALLGVQAVTLWLVADFFVGFNIGAGDSYYYSLQLADFLTQLHQGIFPVFVGQSAWGFNGNIHTVRTAPYFVHLGGVLDLLTGGQLNVYGVQNLCLIVSMLGGATASYVAVRMLAPAWRAAAPLLAALYVLCPAIMVILACMDMYPTIMTLPWLPFFWLGVAGCLQPDSGSRPLIVSTGALAIIWHAHPAVAVWLMPFWLAALLIHAGRGAAGPGRIVRPLLACAALGWLITYLFVSVSTLQLHYANNSFGTAAASILTGLQSAWPDAWFPLAKPLTNLSNIQLGYAFTAIGLAALASLRRTGLPGVFFGGVACALLLLLLPVPGVTHALWSIVPNRVIDATNVWPMQRFYPILAAMFPIWAALTLRTLRPSALARWSTLGFLAAAVGWSAWQDELPRAHARLVRHSFADTQRTLAPTNATLTRGSYLFFGFYPAYYSDGVMDPAFESRLLNADMNQVLLENGAGLYQLKSKSAPIAVLTPGHQPTSLVSTQRTENSFETDGHSRYLLHFDFGGTPSGGLEVAGRVIKRYFIMPLYGNARAFGAGPEASRFLPISPPPGPPETITLQTEIPGLSARVYAYQPDELPIRTNSLIPLQLSLNAPMPGFLETPRVFIPGYQATVNGARGRIVRTPEGLVAVQVATGPQEVVVTYVGPPVLRLAFWFSVAGFIMLPLLSVVAWRRSREISLSPLA